MWWKIYFLILALAPIIIYRGQDYTRIFDVVDLIIYVAALVGLFGFAWKKKIASVSFWKVYFPIYVIWNIYFQYFIPFPRGVYKGDIGDKVHAAIGTYNLLFLIPLLMALYFYAFKKADIWIEKETD